jgi:hypothetical protein
MGRFTDLKPGIEQYESFWRTHVSDAWRLLTDVNYDLMSGKGKFFENFSNTGEPYPQLLIPNLYLIYDESQKPRCTLGIGPAPRGERIRVRASLRGTLVEWRDIKPDCMETTLRTVLVWLMEEGMREIWFPAA